MKALSCMEKMEVNSFGSYYLSKKYKKCLNIGLCKGGNNINNAWQYVIFIYFNRIKINRPTLIVFSKVSNIVIMPNVGFLLVPCLKFTRLKSNSVD